ncbi:WD40 repeat domain-containing protein [Kitasatospora phosalacinea]|uniref:Uncharacterized protein n=1 Tax=Kitasatospora phosalacinea TaxID=2065 RepID=A0A9W6UNC5_9ACTN|nr:hypothetical protein [Kitasatospora phosalacinea]GLW53400.1 hypothetical protein Kpho01_14110 [Kitasatospora phosalacinea]
MEEHRIPPLRAGRRAAGAALLGWLGDARAPRLCRVTGSPGSGRTHLLAWLVAGGTDPAAPPGRRVNAFLPAEGCGVRAAVWQLARQLEVSARTPGELLDRLAADPRPTVLCVPDLDRAADPARLVAELLDPLLGLPHLRLVVEATADLAFTAVAEPAELDLDDPRWTDRARWDAWCGREGHDPAGYPNPGRALGAAPPPPPGPAELLARAPRTATGAPDLPAAGPELLTGLWAAAARSGDLGPLAADPLLYVLAEPVAVTTALEAAAPGAAPAALDAAWRAAGPALVDTPEPAVRAHQLRTRLLGTEPADPAAALAADRLAAAPGRWAARWARRGPAPAATAPGAGPLRGRWLLADATGAVHALSPADGAVLGRIAVPGPKPLRALAATPGGSLVLLDAWGGTELLTPGPTGPGLEPYALDEALARLAAAVDGEALVLAASPDLPDAAPALGDSGGGVHWYRPGGGVLGEKLHTGPVTALAVGTAAPGVPLLASGGLDGAVRLWGPGSAPMPEPADHRPCPVTALALDAGPDGPVLAVAWADGLVRVRRPQRPDGVLDLRLGSPATGLSLAGGVLLAGLDDGPVALDLRD